MNRTGRRLSQNFASFPGAAFSVPLPRRIFVNKRQVPIANHVLPEEPRLMYGLIVLLANPFRWSVGGPGDERDSAKECLCHCRSKVGGGGSAGRHNDDWTPHSLRHTEGLVPGTSLVHARVQVPTGSDESLHQG
jgi:hypothetical protein